jgi:hypothetical protein
VLASQNGLFFCGALPSAGFSELAHRCHSPTSDSVTNSRAVRKHCSLTTINTRHHSTRKRYRCRFLCSAHFLITSTLHSFVPYILSKTSSVWSASWSCDVRCRPAPVLVLHPTVNGSLRRFNPMWQSSSIEFQHCGLVHTFPLTPAPFFSNLGGLW